MPITTRDLARMHADGEKIAMLTCYDASFAALLDAQGVDVILVGDSLGMVLKGERDTLAVTLDEIAYHTASVARGVSRCFLLSDLPFGSYQRSREQAFDSSVRLMAAGAQMVKLEGGAAMAPTVEFLVARGVPVCGHLGLTPQSVHALGGWRVQGRDEQAAARLKADARALADAGAAMIVLEMVPAALAQAVTEDIGIPTIGIGAGVRCSGQVLVLHDMLDVFPGRKAKFVRNFMQGAGSIGEAIAAYVREVKAGTFPTAEHEY